ncbi:MULTISPECIES: hypothetical protein [unclassified Pseudomonas]|uniref:hypothetical protein n=1 Tax=unclassified Pseudomonas TaxID=196821 RepID=UPI001B333115|nr:MULTISPECIES: hypothetical protein [unclassified Pseudomonas]MBP5944700.1 hypothetical protein [Pseudomonas sp. P9(2020)]MBZ9561251.1 hypothetical protein [Pseudomonas sp. P116]
MTNSQNISYTYYEDFQTIKTYTPIPEAGYTTIHGLTIHMESGEAAIQEEYEEDIVLAIGSLAKARIKLSTPSTEIQIVGTPWVPTTVALYDAADQLIGRQSWEEDTISFDSKRPITYLKVYCLTPGADVYITSLGWSE